MIILDHYHPRSDDEKTCPTCGDHVYEIQIRERTNTRCRVTAYIFRSWTGLRWVDGTEYHGPVYLLGTNEVKT